MTNNKSLNRSGGWTRNLKSKSLAATRLAQTFAPNSSKCGAIMGEAEKAPKGCCAVRGQQVGCEVGQGEAKNRVT